MYEPTDSIPTADEIADAVRALRDERDDLQAQVGELSADLGELREQLEKAREEEVVIVTVDLPGGRRWAFVEDAKVLAIAPDLDEEARRRLLAQVEPPKLTTCGTCGAPMYEGIGCRMHGS